MTHLAFAAWFTGTVVVTRLFLWLRPTPSPTVAGFRIHHWMTGLAVGGAVAVLYSHTPTRDMPYPVAALSAVGTGLFADEATYLATGGRTHADNYSRRSLVGTLAIVCVTNALLLLSGTP